MLFSFRRAGKRSFLTYGFGAQRRDLFLAQAQVRLVLFDHRSCFTHIELWSRKSRCWRCVPSSSRCSVLAHRILYHICDSFQWAYLFGSALAVALGLVPVLKTPLPVQLMLFGDAAFGAVAVLFCFGGNIEAGIFATGFLGAGAIAVYDAGCSGFCCRTQLKLGHIGYALFL